MAHLEKDIPLGTASTGPEDAVVHLDTQSEGKRFATQNTLRMFYGYDHASRQWGSGLSVEEEKKRSENLSYLINPGASRKDKNKEKKNFQPNHQPNHFINYYFHLAHA